MGEEAVKRREPLTEEERFVAGNRMVRAAIGVLGGRHTVDESEVAMRVVRAVRAARSARAIEAKKVGVDVWALPETLRAVCAAFGWWLYSGRFGVAPGKELK